jgi:hypothetical protein
MIALAARAQERHHGVMGGSARRRRVLGRAGRALAYALGVRPVARPDPALETLARLCADLHRLDLEIARLMLSDRRTPALYHRLRSASLAYDAALRDACRALHVEVDGAPPFDGVVRIEAEAGLAAAGLSW